MNRLASLLQILVWSALITYWIQQPHSMLSALMTGVSFTAFAVTLLTIARKEAA